jgi:cysteine sulfinate desulfinase/cysteine desulfurase-like protein
MIYLDYNATTPVAPEVAQAMRPFLDGFFGNPSSSHKLGLEARDAVERARRQIAELLGCSSQEVLFTSGGTESNNTAIIGTARALKNEGRHIVTSSIEHPAVTEVCVYLEREEGFRITTVPVDSAGLVDPAAVESAITTETILVTIMHANNEVGTIQPIADIVDVARNRGSAHIRVHTDGAQSVGKVETDVGALGVDLFSVAGHKLYAPKGVGALYIKDGTKLAKLMHGASHENNLRAGTENVLEIVGLGAAAESARTGLDANAKHMRFMRDRLLTTLSLELPSQSIVINGHAEKRLPNTLSVSFPGLEANTILDELTDVAASAGAACHAEQVSISHVLAAMGVEQHVAMGTIRLSTGRGTTAEEVDEAARQIVDVVGKLSQTRVRD